MDHLSEEQIKILIKYICDNSNKTIKQQQLYCFRTKKLTLAGTIAITTLLVSLTTKFFEALNRRQHEQTN